MGKIINEFPGYEFINGKNMYRDVDMGFGGYVYAEPGIHTNVALLDVQSMHPNSAVNLNAFGEYTRRFKDILDARVAIKHGDFDSVRNMFDGKLAPYLNDEETAADLAQALKIAINSVYGLTLANFDNPFRDIRNKNNIVALRGALFMKTLQDEVAARGFTVAHIKTDSIKIADATSEIIKFVSDFGRRYGYIFEHEATYEKMCLVNDAVYVAKYATVEQCIHLYGESYVNQSKDTVKENKKHPSEWTATGTQFQIPYVFKKLFSRESIEFEDMCETKSVTTALHLDMNESLPDVSEYEEVKEYRRKFPDYTQVGFEASRKADNLLKKYKGLSDEELNEKIAVGHNYIFIGKVGQFCPIKPGCGGGILCREGKDKEGNVKYSSATGAKGYRWLESEMVRELGKQNDIDRSYYDKLVDGAVEAISEYGDFEWFVSDDPVPPVKADNPPWTMPCGDEKYKTCFECPNFHDDQIHSTCLLEYDISDYISFAAMKNSK